MSSAPRRHAGSVGFTGAGSKRRTQPFLHNKLEPVDIRMSTSKLILWVKKAAERGDAEAAMKLAECYMKGEGVEKNEEEALAWFRKAAEMKSKGSAATEATPAPAPDPAPTTEASAQSPTPAPVAPTPAEAPQTTQPKKGRRCKLWVAVAAGLVILIGGGVGAYYMLREDPYVAYQRLTKEGKVIEAMERLREAAEDGNAEAQFKLGVCYENGDGVSKNPMEAARWYQAAAEQGVEAAQCSLGVYYANGWGVGKDLAQAVKWYSVAAERGYAKAQFLLGLCYERGEGVSEDMAEAVKWYRLAAKQGNMYAQCNLGLCYEKGSGANKNPMEAVKWYRAAAEQGLAEAQYHLGNCYFLGSGVSRDMAEAVKWYRPAAEKGITMAQLLLGACYSRGEGVSKDVAEAARWFRAAAEQGNAEAQNNLGLCYEFGSGVSLDPMEAVKWYRKAAEQGNVGAQNNLGMCYANGKGVSKDMEEAVKCFRAAAEQGYAEAQRNLGACYANGWGVSKDMTEAVKWLRAAAEQGDAEAQKNLDMCSANGSEVNKDTTEVAEDESMDEDVRKAKQIQTELKEKDEILVLPEAVKRAEKVVMRYWKKELFADDKEGSGKGVGTDGYHSFDIRFRRYAQAFYWDIFEDMHCFSWLAVMKEYIPQHLDTGKGLLKEFLTRADKEAEQLTFSPYETQTSFRLALLQYAIDICQLRVDESISCSKLYSGQAQTRLHLAEMSYSNHVTTFKNLYRSMYDREEKKEKKQKH